MLPWNFVGLLVVLGHVQGQGVSPANVLTPEVITTLGKEAVLSCSTSQRLRFCVWERVSKDDKEKNSPFIVNFNEITSQPGLYSGMSGYSYAGEGFRTGECGVKIGTVKKDDFAKWQCTLIADDIVYRGQVELQESPKEDSVAASRFASAETNGNLPLSDNRPRPIITSYNDARAIIQPELIVHSASNDVGGSQLIQEVKVESAGLQIKPKRGGKLIVFE